MKNISLGKSQLYLNILVRHEQSAAHAYIPQIKVGLFFTSGPGAKISKRNARMDSIPMIIITSGSLIGTDFQETDILGLHYLLLNILTQ
jgi:thiamine pyrophosphate-dependent acetolactate synthase large subunit-like protein